MKVSNIIYELWESQVNQKYLFRGMSDAHLINPLDASKNPFEDAFTIIEDFFNLLERLVKHGFVFDVIEKHGNKVYQHSLDNIVRWSKRDLKNPRIDFTSSYQAACEYADNWCGSQLKQNLKFVTDHLSSHDKDPVVRKEMSLSDWDIVVKVDKWVNQQVQDHRPIVLWVRRSADCFNAVGQCPLVGSLSDFTEWAKKIIQKEGEQASREMLLKYFPKELDEWYAHLNRPLYVNEIDKIEKINPSL